MTGKQKAMITERLADPKATNADIIRRAGYKASTVFSASQQYLDNMKLPEIASKLNPVVDEIEQVMIDNVRQFKGSKVQWQRQLSNDNARWIHDKVKGKATQITEIKSTKLNINIDLSGMAEAVDT